MVQESAQTPSVGPAPGTGSSGGDGNVPPPSSASPKVRRSCLSLDQAANGRPAGNDWTRWLREQTR